MRAPLAPLFSSHAHTDTCMHTRAYTGANSLAWFLCPAKSAGAAVSASAAWLGLFVTGIFWSRVTRKPLEVLSLAPLVLITAAGRWAHLTKAISSAMVAHVSGHGSFLLSVCSFPFVQTFASPYLFPLLPFPCLYD